ncbi:MAG: hypothetical protein D6675_10610 [Gemmatimonadetes bacterium]|nr:MAG: hypothetical protein D6675_10610 [Gemmatimonadota bacterium]
MPATSNFYCSAASTAAKEHLYGTAPHYQFWFIIEYHLPWREKAAKDNDLPPAMLEHLQQAMAKLPNARLMLIKNDTPQPDRLQFYAINSQRGKAAIYPLTLTRYEDLLSVNLVDLVTGTSGHPAHFDPLILVCTHGKHDKCCAKWGLPVYRALKAHGDEPVWQSTHIGGHRFAPTMLVFPHALSFGRLTPETAVEVIAEYRHHRIHLETYRGRCADEAPVQVADYWVRKHANQRGLNQFQLHEYQQTGEQHHVTFCDESGTLHVVELRSQPDKLQLHTSCAAATPSMVIQYEFRSYQVRSDGGGSPDITLPPPR